MRGILLFLLIVLASCSGNKKYSERQYQKNVKDAFIYFFKVQAYCSCVQHAYANKEIVKLQWEEDLMGSYDGLAYPEVLKAIDSLGRAEASKIKPSEYADFEGKKRITAACLDFYTGKTLDSVATAMYKKHEE